MHASHRYGYHSRLQAQLIFSARRGRIDGSGLRRLRSKTSPKVQRTGRLHRTPHTASRPCGGGSRDVRVNGFGMLRNPAGGMGAAVEESSGSCKPDSVPPCGGGAHLSTPLARSPARAGAAYPGPSDGPPGPLFGLAPDWVYPAPSIALGAVGSYPTISPLPRDGRGAVYFLWHFPSDGLEAARPRFHGESRPVVSGLSSTPPKRRRGRPLPED